MDAAFVGHPLAELSSTNLPKEVVERSDYATQNNLDLEKYWITLMPGSRVKEVHMNLPGILESATQFGRVYEFLLPVAPTLDRHWIQGLIGNAAPVHLVSESLPALYHSRAGIIASGTATVEAAMMSLPFVMVYRVSPLTYWLGKPRVKVPYFAMVNLIAGQEVVPELVQHDFIPAKVVAQLNEILPDGPSRDKMLEGLASVKAALRGPDNGNPHPQRARHPSHSGAATVTLNAPNSWRPCRRASFA